MKKDRKNIKEEHITSALNKVVELFKTGDVPKAISIVTFPPYKDIPSNEWSLANRIIMSKSDTSDGRGFAQWKFCGRYPIKGSKAIHILAPRIVKKKKKNEEVQKSDSEEKEEDSEDHNKKQEFVLVGFTPIPIFRYEDTTGNPVEYQEHELPNLPLIEKAHEWGINVKQVTFQGKFYGYYRSGACEQIRLASPNESVFFHELSHAAHKRVKGKLKKSQHAKQEIVAELSAQVLAQLVGTELESTLGNSYEYILRYAKDMKKDIGLACLSVLSEVEQVLKLILEG